MDRFNSSEDQPNFIERFYNDGHTARHAGRPITDAHPAWTALEIASWRAGWADEDQRIASEERFRNALDAAKAVLKAWLSANLNAPLGEDGENSAAYRKQDNEIEVLHRVVAELAKRGFMAVLQGGGAGWPWVEVTLDSGKVVTLGSPATTWCGEIYPHHVALAHAADCDGYDTGVPATESDPVKIVDAFEKAVLPN